MKSTQITPLLLLLSIFLWTGCSEDEKVGVQVTPELEIMKSVNCDWKGTPVAVAVRTNQTEWLATVNEEAAGWCSFIPRRDSIVIKPFENQLDTERRAIIIVTAGGLADTLEVIQEQGANPFCRVSEKELHFIWQENIMEVVVSTNQASWESDLKVGIGASDWCSMKKVENRLVITAERNETKNQRTASITITAGRAEPVVVTLDQEGKKDPVAGVLVFDVTKEFTESNIYEVWNADLKVAEICYEYIPSVDLRSRTTVVYPMKDGKPDLSNGYVTSTGGRAEWKNGECNYTPGSLSAPAEKLVVDGGILSVVITGSESPATVLPAILKDGGKNKYSLVKIGTQYWMAENMRTKYYADGSAIGTDYNSADGAWSLYDDGKVSNGDIETMGLLYTWYVIGRITPAGWHAPDSTEWQTLQTYLGDKDAVLMRKADPRWSTPCEATNLSGFAAIPCGYRWDGTGRFPLNSAKEGVNWWTTDQDVPDKNGSTTAFYWRIVYNSASSELASFRQNFSYSIRLLKD